MSENNFIFHISDTYSLRESKIGKEIDLPGFGRIYSILKSFSKTYQEKNILFLHSGDFLFPSFLSSFFKGKQMIDVLNHCGLDCCTLGNHDFDGGLEILEKRINESKFKYILTNLSPPYSISKKILRYYVWPNISPVLAIVGIAGQMTSKKASENGFKIKNLKTSLNQVLAEIKKEYPKIKLLVVLSHMGDSEDLDLKKILNKIGLAHSIILGGHDHKKVFSYDLKSDKCMLVKGQSNARTIQMIKINEKIDLENQDLKKNLVFLSSKNYQQIIPSREIEKKIDFWYDKLKNKKQLPSNRIIKKFPKGVILDGTEESLRHGTTNFGNFVTDCLKKYTGADIALINSGHFRSDRRFLEKLRLSDLFTTFVMKQKGNVMTTKMTKKECVLFLTHAYEQDGKGKVLQFSKDALKILEKAKNNTEFNMALISDMLFTNEDEFAKILAKNRKISITKLRKLLKNDIDENLDLIDGILKTAKQVNYDPNTRLKVGTNW